MPKNTDYLTFQLHVLSALITGNTGEVALDHVVVVHVPDMKRFVVHGAKEQKIRKKALVTNSVYTDISFGMVDVSVRHGGLDYAVKVFNPS